MKKRRMMQILALVIVFSMMLSTAAFAMSPGHYKQLDRSVKYYEHAADYMMKNKIIQGYGDGNFGFRDYVKRGDIAVMIERAFKLSSFINEYEDAFDDDKFFDDVDKSDYFYRAIFAAKKFGIAKGDGKRKFNPKKMVTIEETILLIERSIEATDKFTEDLDLRDLFDKDELDDFASRQDVALMLYKVLTDADYEEDEDVISDIEYKINDEDELNFSTIKFETAFEDVEDDTNENIEYVKFDLPVKNGNLYYDYDNKEVKNTLVRENAEFYVNNNDEKEIENITFVPNDNFNGTTYIRYFAYIDEDTSYEGLIKITVDGEEMLDDINIKIKENAFLNFTEDDFEGFIDEVVFVLPDNKVGTLYFDDDNDGVPEGDELLDKGEVIEDENLDDIIFEPYEDFTGNTVIEYTAYDGTESYSGEIKIVVQEVQEIGTMKLTIQEDMSEVVADFAYKLENLIDDDDFYENIDYVVFELPEEGTLKIELNGKYYTFDSSDVNDEYDIDDIDEIKYLYNGEETPLHINFTVYDFDDDAHDGVIKVTVE